MSSSDIHEKKPTVSIPLQEVGVTNVSIPVRVALGKKSSFMVPKISAFIDLPSKQKGIHASRSSEAIVETVSEQARKRVKLEDLCAKIAERLLKKHPYARRASVSAEGEAIVTGKTPVTKVRTFEPYTIRGNAVAGRMGKRFKIRKTIGVEIIGMTVCPCASHMQRSYATVMIEVPEKQELNALTLIEVAKEAMSAPTYELLKRADELAVVKKATERPRFAEDSLRFMAKSLVERLQDLPNDTYVFISIRSLESIHKHDFVARREATLGVLRKEISKES